MASDSDREWKYSIEDVGEDAEDGEETESTEEAAEIDRRVEPGSPSLENALFVVLGALLALGTIAYGLGLF